MLVKDKQLVSRLGLGQRARAVRQRLEAFWHHGITRLVLAIVVLVVVGSTIVYLLENREGGLYSSVWEGVYWAVVTIATVGYGDIVPKTPWGRLTAMVMMLAGMGLISLLTATIASGFVAQSIKEAKGLGTTKTKGHIVICGWNQNAEKVIQGLVDAWGSRVRPAVLINQLPEEAINEILYKYRDWQLQYIRGDFSQESCLERANIRDAVSAVILADTLAGTTDQVDQHTILGTLAIKNLNPQVKIYAEAMNPESEAHLRQANADEVVVSGEYNAFLLSAAAATPGIIDAARTLLTYGGKAQLRRASIPTQYVGSTFKELFSFFREHHEAILIGVITERQAMSLQDVLGGNYTAVDEFIIRKFKEAGREFEEKERGGVSVSVNPKDDYRISESDWALVISTAPIRGR